MTQKERLVELFRNSSGVFVEGSEMEYAVADYLLANGAIVPPCKVGDKVYLVYANKITEIEIQNKLVRKNFVGYNLALEDGELVVDFFEDKIGDCIFVTRTEAEQALKERE